MTRLVSQQELAEELGITDRQVRRLQREGVLLTEKMGRRTYYAQPACYHAYLKHKTENGPTTARAQLDATRQRKLAAEAERAELLLAALRGDLLDRADVARQWETALRLLGARMDAAPSRWRDEFVGIATAREAAEKLKRVFTEMRTELATLGESPDLDSDDALAA
jgi:hypothetical protein